MGPSAIHPGAPRRDPRVDGSRSEGASKPKSKKSAKGQPSPMNMENYATAAERNGVRPSFGALGSATTPSMDQQIAGAINRAKTEGKAMDNLAHAAADAYRSLPNLSRGAAAITGGVNAGATVQNLAGAAVESLVSLDTHPIARAADDAAYSIGLVAGELNAKVDHAKGLYHTFSKQYADYKQVNQQYQNALQSHDNASIKSLAARKDALKTAMLGTAESLNHAVRAVGKEDKRFEAATVHAAEHLVASAIGAGVGGAHEALLDNAIHIAAETAVTKGYQRVIHGNEH